MRAVQVCLVRVSIEAGPRDATYILLTQFTKSSAIRRIEDLRAVRLFLSRTWSVPWAAEFLFHRVVR
jgi:hypothetical protein